MSTRSRIGIKNTDGSIRSIYCHNDGYLSHVGALLREFYPNRVMVNALMDLGDLSALYRNIAPLPGQKHSYGAPVRGVTIAYNRDRLENNVESVTHPRETAFLAEAEDSGVNFAYLFDGEDWWVWTGLPFHPSKKSRLTIELISEAMTA